MSKPLPKSLHTITALANVAKYLNTLAFTPAAAVVRACDFTPRFCRGVLDLGSKYTFHKATSLPGDWYSLAMALDGGLMLAARGEAFATT